MDIFVACVVYIPRPFSCTINLRNEFPKTCSKNVSMWGLDSNQLQPIYYNSCIHKVWYLDSFVKKQLNPLDPSAIVQMETARKMVNSSHIGYMHRGGASWWAAWPRIAQSPSDSLLLRCHSRRSLHATVGSAGIRKNRVCSLHLAPKPPLTQSPHSTFNPSASWDFSLSLSVLSQVCVVNNGSPMQQNQECVCILHVAWLSSGWGASCASSFTPREQEQGVVEVIVGVAVAGGEHRGGCGSRTGIT